MRSQWVFVSMIAASATVAAGALLWVEFRPRAVAPQPDARVETAALPPASDASAALEPLAAEEVNAPAPAEPPATPRVDGAPPPPASKLVPLPEDIWKPAATPKDGVAWSLLESTKELTRLVDGIIYSRPVFPPGVKALEGTRIRVAGYMMPLESAPAQRHFALMAYPPGCPFHFHALPNQFIEVYADTPVPLDETGVTVVSGVLELIGHDEKGIFYRLRKAKAG